MLVSVLVWAYARGESSSRRIGQRCVTDGAFRVICGGKPGGRKPFPPGAHAGVAKARGALERAKAKAAAAERKAATAKEPVRNVTDVDSRLMPVRGGGSSRATTPRTWSAKTR